MKGTIVSSFCNGTIRTRYTGTFTLDDDGTFAVVIEGRFVGGTGALEGATSSYRATGRADPVRGVTLRSTHPVPYPRGVLGRTAAPDAAMSEIIFLG